MKKSVDGSPKKVEEEAHGAHSNCYLLGAINAIKDREHADFPPVPLITEFDRQWPTLGGWVGEVFFWWGGCIQKNQAVLTSSWINTSQ